MPSMCLPWMCTPWMFMPSILRQASWQQGSLCRARIRLQAQQGRTAGGGGARGDPGAVGLVVPPPWLRAGITGKGPALCLCHRGPLWSPEAPLVPRALEKFTHSRFLPLLLVLCLGAEGAEESPSPLLRPLKLFTPLKAIISPRILRHTCQCAGFIPETP